MSNELPKMYQNKIKKEFSNIQKVFSTLYEDRTLEEDKTSDMYTVEQKIYNIFKSPTYIYKMDVIIVTNEGKKEKRIVGKNKDNLITFENEYIPINTIKDIYIK